MKDVKSLLDYFIEVNASHGEGYVDADIDAHLRLFCEQLQAKINHPFSDGGSEPNYDDLKWRSWRDEYGVHVADKTINDGTHEYLFTVKAENLTLYEIRDGKPRFFHGRTMEWYNHIYWKNTPGDEVSIRFVLYGAVVDLSDDVYVKKSFEVMRRILKNSENTKFVLEQLKRDDVWNYLIPNIVITKE